MLDIKMNKGRSSHFSYTRSKYLHFSHFTHFDT